MPREVLVTGLGIVSPAGGDAGKTWQFLRAGGRAVGRFAWGEFGYRHFPGAFLGAPVRDFTCPAGMDERDRVCQFAVAAADEAARCAGLIGGRGVLRRSNRPARTAVSIGTSKGGILSFDSLYHQFLTESSHSTYLRTLVCDVPPDAPSRHIAARYCANGPVHATVAACSTGTLAVIRGAQMIADGAADLVFAGSSDASIHPLWLAAFENMGVLAGEHPQRGPAWACRPFDRRRDGFVPGEGAAVMVLESGESAARRGARPLARLAGWAMGSDPAGLSQLSEDATPLAETIRSACRRAQVPAHEIAAVMAHGTGTDSNDRVEVRAVSDALGSVVADIPIVSVKGVVGHLLGAAGAVELAVAVLAIHNRQSPGNTTLIEADPQFGPLNLPREPVSVGIGPILKTSLGFGGHVAAVIVDRP